MRGRRAFCSAPGLPLAPALLLGLPWKRTSPLVLFHPPAPALSQQLVLPATALRTCDAAASSLQEEREPCREL